AIMRDGKYVLRGDWVFYFDIPKFVESWSAVTESPLLVLDYDAATKNGVVPQFLRLIGAPESVVEDVQHAAVLNPRKPTEISASSRVIGGLRLRYAYGRHRYRHLLARS